MDGLSQPLLGQTLAHATLVPATVAACVLASWIEERVYHALAPRGLPLRLFVGITIPFIVPVVGMLTGALFLPSSRSPARGCG